MTIELKRDCSALVSVKPAFFKALIEGGKARIRELQVCVVGLQELPGQEVYVTKGLGPVRSIVLD